MKKHEAKNLVALSLWQVLERTLPEAVKQCQLYTDTLLKTCEAFYLTGIASSRCCSNEVLRFELSTEESVRGALQHF